MAETAHTPGPWRAQLWGAADSPGTRGYIFSDHAPWDGKVAKVFDWTRMTPAVFDANARLIAAAPDLLEALRSLVGALERAAGAGIDLTGHVGLGGALRAIAKAEGRT